MFLVYFGIVRAVKCCIFSWEWTGCSTFWTIRYQLLCSPGTISPGHGTREARVVVQAGPSLPLILRWTPRRNLVMRDKYLRPRYIAVLRSPQFTVLCCNLNSSKGIFVLDEIALHSTLILYKTMNYEYQIAWMPCPFHSFQWYWRLCHFDTASWLFHSAFLTSANSLSPLSVR